MAAIGRRITRSSRSVALAVLAPLAVPVVSAAEQLTLPHVELGAAPEVPDASVSKLFIVAPGIDPLQSDPQPCPPVQFGCNDPYARAADTFEPILDRLGCELAPRDDSTLVGCSDGLAWVPYSYAGLADERPLPYTGAQTGQPLAQSAAYMDELVASLRARPEVGAAPIMIVAHSLGGAVSTFWGASNPDVPVLTFDSPVNSIWPADPDVSNVYCNASVGLFTFTQAEACNLLFFIPAASSAAVEDLRRPETVQQMGQATQLNFANAQDAFVPTWFAVSRTPTLGAVLMSSSCRSFTDPIFNHFCIIDTAAAEAAAYIADGTLPSRTPIRETIELSIRATAGGRSVDGTVTATRLGEVVAQAQTSGGRATLTVPWLDVLVTFTDSSGTMMLGALPGEMTDLSLHFDRWTTPPTKSCSPVDPAVNGTTSCTMTLTRFINLGVLVQDTVVSPSGSGVSDCSTTQRLLCSVRAPDGVDVRCPLICFAGTSWTTEITGGSAGPLEESVVFTPNPRGSPVLTFDVQPSPPVTFGDTTPPQPTPTTLLLELEEAAAEAHRTLGSLVTRAREQLEAGRDVVACGLLRGFLTRVRVYERVGLITSAQAAQFTADAERVRELLACR